MGTSLLNHQKSTPGLPNEERVSKLDFLENSPKFSLKIGDKRLSRIIVQKDSITTLHQIQPIRCIIRPQEWPDSLTDPMYSSHLGVPASNRIMIPDLF